MNGEQEQRGAGSGEQAVAKRSQQQQSGQPAKPEDVLTHKAPSLDNPAEIPRKQVVDALEKERDAQAEYNQQAHDAQLKVKADLDKKIADMAKETTDDPDKLREDAKKAEEEANDPKKKQAMLDKQKELRAEKFKQPQEK